MLRAGSFNPGSPPMRGYFCAIAAPGRAEPWRYRLSFKKSLASDML